MYAGYCTELREVLKAAGEPVPEECCGSCHDDDEEFGYEMCEIEREDKTYYVCCRFVA